MKKLRLTTLRPTVLAATLAILALSACQQEAGKPLTAAEKIVAPNEHVKGLLEKAASVSSQAKVKSDDTLSDYQEDNGSMNTVVFDGNSETSFQTSMEEFQSIANSSQINALNSAINYLKFYDLSTRGNMEKLYQTLDGLTAEQIILRAKGIRRN